MLIGHQAIQEELRQLIANGKVPHALLFTGPKGVGKRTLAETLIRHLVCGPAYDDDKGLTFNTKHPDYPRLEAGSYTSFFTLQPTTKKSIAVEDVRQSLVKLSFSDENWRILLVDSADDLNQASANALLKTLEEPNSRTLIILISHQPAGLLPTIVSRCRRYAFTGLEPKDLQQVLRMADTSEINPATLDALAPLAGGSPGWLLNLAEKAGKSPEIINRFMQNLTKADMLSIRQAADSLCLTCDDDEVLYGILLQTLKTAALQGQKREAEALATAYRSVAEIQTNRQIYSVNRNLSVEKALSEVVWAAQNA